MSALSYFTVIKIHSNYDTGMNKMKRNMKITVKAHGDSHVSFRDGILDVSLRMRRFMRLSHSPAQQ